MYTAFFHVSDPTQNVLLYRPEGLIDYLKNHAVDGIMDCTINIVIVRVAT